MARPSSLSRAGVAASWGNRLAGLLCRVGNRKSKSCSAAGPATANPSSMPAVRLVRSLCASLICSVVGTAPWAKRGMAAPLPADRIIRSPVTEWRDHPRLWSVRRGCKVSLSHHRPSPPSAPSTAEGAGVMNVRRVLTILAVVAALASWPALAHAAPSQPERRSDTGRSSPTAAAAAVSVEADFDNDGFADLAVGVPREGVGTAELAGAVNILAGSPAGLSGAGSQQFVQGSGGVPGEDIGTITNAGAVTVLYGSATGLSGSGAQVFSQDSPGVLGAAEAEDGFGSALGVGDFDNDGADDLAIGVPSEGFGAISQAGAVNLLYGSGSGLT